MTMATINMITMSLVMYSGYKDYEFWNDVNKTNKKIVSVLLYEILLLWECCFYLASIEVN